MLLALSLATAWAEGPTLGEWVEAYGAPSKDVALAQRVRGDDEPLLVYWLQATAAPLGLGSSLPGTLVANFDAAQPSQDSELMDFTFLALAEPGQQASLEAALRDAGWVVGEERQELAGGRFQVLQVETDSGYAGTVALREGGGAGMADGRPSPTVLLHLAAR